MHTEQELVNMSKEQLITLILSMQETMMHGKKIVEYYSRKSNKNGKFAEITTDYVANLMLNGYFLTDIQKKIKDDFNIDISLQALNYRIRKYERDNNVQIYSGAKKGRKKKVKQQ